MAAGAEHEQGAADVEDPRLRLAYQEGQLALARQAESLERLRTRATGLISVASVSASVLGGFALPEDGTSRGELVAFGVGIVAFGVMAVLTGLLLWPIVLTTENDAGKIVTDYVDEGWSMSDLLRYLAIYAADNHKANAAKLEPRFQMFVGAIMALGVLVVSFALSLALGAR